MRRLGTPRADLGEWQAELGGASWPKADKRVLAYRVDALSLDPSSEPYLLWVAVFGSGIVGRIGCHFAPNSSGDVEIGYVVDKGWRGLRVANWMLDTFLATLAGMGVLPVTAAVAPGNRPSSTLLSRRGFRRFSKQLDPEDGVEHLYRFRYEPSLLGV